MQQDRGAYLIAGSGSATDSGATQANRLKMATTVDAIIISDVVKVVEI